MAKEDLDTPIGRSHEVPDTRLTLASAAFARDTVIPRRYTMQGENHSPPLAWAGVPTGTQSLALSCDDPDAPSGTFTHWLLWNIPPSMTALHENLQLQPGTQGLMQGTNDFGKVGWGGPQPPKGPPHHYRFHLYALDAPMTLGAGASPRAFTQALDGHVIGETTLVGLFQS